MESIYRETAAGIAATMADSAVAAFASGKPAPKSTVYTLPAVGAVRAEAFRRPADMGVGVNWYRGDAAITIGDAIDAIAANVRRVSHKES